MPVPLPARQPQPATGNRLLAVMTRAERSLVVQTAEWVAYPAGATLFVPGEEIRHIYFPEAGLVSLLAELPDGEATEVGMIGREGLVGLPALLGDPVAGLRAVVQVATHGHRVAAAALLMLADGSRNLRTLIRQLAMARLTHAGRSAACNTMHPLEQRTARWLLEASDRVGPNIPVTQERLAVLLGARRPSLNLVLRQLTVAGLIRHARGQLAVSDPQGLEAAACPCYRLIRETHARLFPTAFPDPGRNRQATGP